jgi:hypothetical protein
MNTRIISFKPSACPYPIPEVNWEHYDAQKKGLNPSTQGLDINQCTLVENGEPVFVLIDKTKGRVVLLLHSTPPANCTEEELLDFAARIKDTLLEPHPNPLPIF